MEPLRIAFAFVFLMACTGQPARRSAGRKPTTPVAIPAATCRLNPWADQLGQSAIVTAHRMPTHEVLVLADGTIRAFDGFGSVHRERSRCETGLSIVSATRHDRDYEVLTDRGEVFRVTPSPCRKRQLPLSRVPEDVTELRVCGGQLVAQHRDGAVRLWSATGELLD